MFCKQLCSQYVPDVARGFPVRYPSSCADDCFSPQVECPSVPFDDQCLRLADRRAYVDEHGEYVFSLVSFAWGVRRTFARSESVGVGGAETCFPCGYRTDRGCFPFSVRFVCRAGGMSQLAAIEHHQERVLRDGRIGVARSFGGPVRRRRWLQGGAIGRNTCAE